MKDFNRFGNMNPSSEHMARPYLMNRPAFKICGNLYFVGNQWCSSHLIDTGEGLILLDTPCGDSLTGLIDGIWSLGFNPKDLKYIVVSHAHTDHYGAVKALVHMTGAKTFLGAVDAKDMREHYHRCEAMNHLFGHYNEGFEPDVELEDGDCIELGNTRIRCVLTPGHTIGVMSHFWTLEDQGRRLNVGIYGGAGFASIAEEALKRDGEPLSLQKAFGESIDKVWNEPVDIMLGNHPFHNDTYVKYQRMCQGEKDVFIDPTEWRRFLTELKQRYQKFLTLSPAEIADMYAESQYLDYYCDL